MSVADELKKLAELRDSGVLTEAEFQAQKEKAMSGQPQSVPPVAAMPEKKKGMGVFPMLLIGAAVLFGIFLVIGATADDGPGSAIHDGLAIDSCWGEHDRKSIAPAEKRFMAGACEKMEREFQERHGYKHR